MKKPTGLGAAIRSSVAARHGLGLVTILVGTICAGCERQAAAPDTPLPTVEVSKAVVRTVPVILEETGQAAAVNSVALVARVQGFLEKIGYIDGEEVKKGTELFVIEPPPFKAQLDQAQATLLQNQAKELFAGQQSTRFSTLARQNDAPQMQAEQTLASLKEAQAQVLQAKAAVEQAQITLSYTRVVAPFDGVVSAHLQDVGALVGGAQPTQLASIVQLDPIWVNFNISEADVARARATMAERGLKPKDLHSVEVEVALGPDNEFTLRGHIDYTAPQIDPGTGTLAVRAVLANESHALLPGNFVRARLRIGRHVDALLVPEAAIGSQQGSDFVLVVDADGVVAQRNVRTGMASGGERIIATGLGKDERVIVRGMAVVRPGDHVEVREVTAAAGTPGAGSASEATAP